MGVITRLESGFLFSDNFTDTGLSNEWDLFPYDLTRVEKKTDSVVLKHGTEPLHMILTMLTNEDECVLDVKNSYIPTVEGDVGGIVVIGATDERVCLEEYFDTSSNQAYSYPWVRLVKSFNNYSAYWSEDGSGWNLIGSSYLGSLSPKIGIFIGGENGSDYEVQEVFAYKSSRIRVSNLSPGMEVNIHDEQGALVRSVKCLQFRDFVDINVSDLSMPFNGTFSFNMPDGTSFEDDTLYSICGGDKFTFNITPVLYYEHTDVLTGVKSFKQLLPNIEEFMGYFGANHGITARVRMKMVNPYAGTFKDTTLKVVQYLTNYHEHNVYLGEDVNGSMGNPTKALIVQSLGIGEEYDFWVQMERGNIALQSANQLTFGINVVTRFE